MWWRASLLFMAVLLGSIVCAWRQPLGRAVLLELPDGSLARDVEVRWLDARGRVGEAEPNPDGSWSIAAETRALEVTGESVADAIHFGRKLQTPRISLEPSARLEVRVQAPPGEDLTGLRLLAFSSEGSRRTPAIRWKPDLESTWNELGRNSDGRILHPFIEAFRQTNGVDPDSELFASRGARANLEGWIPADPNQLIAQVRPDGMAVFEELPLRSPSHFRISTMPTDPWVVVDSRPQFDADFGKGESKPIELRDNVTVVDLDLARHGSLELRVPAITDLARVYRLEFLQAGSQPEVERWRPVGFCAGNLHAKSLGRIEFQRLLPGSYRVRVQELDHDPQLMWYSAEKLRLDPGERRSLAERETDPRPGGPLRLRFEDQFGTDLLGEYGPPSSSALRRSLLKSVTLELREFDDFGTLLHASRHECRVRPNGNLLPAPWIPSGRPVQIAILPEYAQDLERSGPWKLDRTAMLQTVESQLGAPCPLTLRLDSGGRTRPLSGIPATP